MKSNELPYHFKREKLDEIILIVASAILNEIEVKVSIVINVHNKFIAVDTKANNFGLNYTKTVFYSYPYSRCPDVLCFAKCQNFMYL